MDTLWLKVILIFVMILITLIAGLVPVRVLKLLRKNAALASTDSQHRSASLTLCLLTCFSGGVFLATCFLDLLPDVNEHLREIKQKMAIASDYPFAELLSCIGFFLVFGLEEIVLKLIPGLHHSHKRDSMTPPHLHVQQTTDNARSSTPNDFYAYQNNAKNDRSADGNVSSLLADGRHNEDDELSKGPLLNQDLSPPPVAVIGNGRVQSRVETRSTQLSPELYASLELAEPERCEMNCAGRDEDPPILMTSRPHAHSHGVRSVTFVLALSFHSVLEGLAFGVQKDSSEVTTLFLSLMIHKAIVAFSVGLQLARTHAHQLRWVAVSILVLSLMTPLGASIGMFVQQSDFNIEVKDIIVLVFEGLAVGTFLYVTFFEVLLHERDNEHPNLLKLFVIIVGFALIGTFRLMKHGHGNDEHDHDEDLHHLNMTTASHI